jgi:acetylornithine deacetylase/succinyl-diaminopimelate desuccinylase-like protein
MTDWKEIGGRAAQILSRYLQIASVNPPGDETETADFLSGLLRERGLSAMRYESGPKRVNLLARLPGDGSASPIVLLHHMDVVPADGTQWSCEPFSGKLEDGYVYGRGALDMKGMGVMQLLALDLLRRSGQPRKRDVIFLAVADEEEGGVYGTQWMLENCWPELEQAEFVWDEGGFGLQDFFGPHPVFSVAVAEKQVLWLRLVVKGEPGHGGMPKGQNAADVLVAAAKRLGEYRTPLKLSPMAQEMFRGVAGLMPFPQSFLLDHLDNPLIFAIARSGLEASPTIAAMLRNTLSLTMLNASPKVNVVPDRAEATFDVRLLPGEDPQAFIAQAERVIADKRVQIEPIQAPEPSTTSALDGELLQAIADVTRRLVPNSVTVPMLTPGATDSCYFRRKGIDTYGLFPAIITPNELTGFHGHNERISVENLRLGTRIIYEVLQKMVA